MAVSLPTAPPSAPSREVELVRFVGSLCTATSLEQLERRFVAGFARVTDAPMYGYDLVDPQTGRPSCIATANVSDAFVARYEREARDVDPVLAQALDTRRPAYNLAMMSADEWEESAVYRRAYRMHGIRHVVEVPVISSGEIIGNLHFAESDRDRDFGPDEIALADALACVLGDTVDRLRTRDRIELERDQALAALDLTATPVVVIEPQAGELRTNAAAERLLAEVVDAEECLHHLLARPASEGPFSRRRDVALATGEAGVLHAASTPLPHAERGLVAVLELQREQPTASPTGRSRSGCSSATTRSASTSSGSTASSRSTRGSRSPACCSACPSRAGRRRRRGRRCSSSTPVGSWCPAG
jgi:hypothetical protein